MSNEYKDWQAEEIKQLRSELAKKDSERLKWFEGWKKSNINIKALENEIERLSDYIAKHNELVQKLTIELVEYQAKEHKVGIKRAKK